MKVHIVAHGTRKLMMHNSRLANPLNSHAKALKELTSKKTKTDEDFYNIARVEFEGGLYHHEDIGPYIPAENLFATIQKGAKLNKNGKDIERGVVLTETAYPLIYDGPRDIDGLWGNGDSQFVDTRVVGVQQNKTTRTRPIFPSDWVFEAYAEIDSDVINFEDFEMAVDKAGKFEGIGDWRKMFGRFKATVSKV